MTRLKNTIVSTFAAGFFLIWTGVTSNISIVGMSVLLAKENNGQASYNRGYQLGRKDARANPNGDKRRHGDETSQWDSDFRRGYEDGQAGRSKNNSAYGRSRNDGYDPWNDGTYDRSRNDGTYDRSRNEDIYGRSSSDPSYRGPGTMTWRGRVDDYVELNIQGNRVRSREREGSQTLNEQVSFSNPLPRADVSVSVRKRSGRGRVSVVQQPNRSNNYTAIVKIDDERGGADDYEIEMESR
jgi:hypothetical protein